MRRRALVKAVKRKPSGFIKCGELLDKLRTG